MAATVTVNVTPTDASVSNRKEKVVDVAYDNSYPTGGYAIAPSAVGLEQILAVLAGGNLAGYIPSYNQATGKLQLFQQSAATGALTEVANTTNVSAVSHRLVFFGW